MHFFKAFTRGGTPCAIVVKEEYLRRVQGNRLHSSREGDTSHGALYRPRLLLLFASANVMAAVLVPLAGPIRTLFGHTVIRDVLSPQGLKGPAGKMSLWVFVHANRKG
jgi:hypothetical protein